MVFPSLVRMVDHQVGHPAVHHEIGGVDKVIFLLTQKQSDTGNILWSTHSGGWMLKEIPFAV